jgi:hypothetical protein
MTIRALHKPVVVTTGTALRAHARAFRTATSLLWRSLVEDAHVELLKSSGFGDELVPLNRLALDVERDDEPQPSTRLELSPRRRLRTSSSPAGEHVGRRAVARPSSAVSR